MMSCLPRRYARHASGFRNGCQHPHFTRPCAWTWIPWEQGGERVLGQVVTFLFIGKPLVFHIFAIALDGISD